MRSPALSLRRCGIVLLCAALLILAPGVRAAPMEDVPEFLQPPAQSDPFREALQRSAPFIDLGTESARPQENGNSPHSLPMTGPQAPRSPGAPRLPDVQGAGLGASAPRSAASGALRLPARGSAGQTGHANGRRSAEGGDLSAMIGQMIMVGFNGFALRDADPLLSSIKAGRVGNLILFERGVTGGPKNIESPSQVRLLTTRLQQAAPRPLFIALDQEGGRVQRLPPERGFEGAPAAAVLGRGSPETTRQIARRMGLEMAAVGVNLDFAPVADLNINPLSPAIGAVQRSFGANPHVTAAHAIAFGEGLAQGGVAPCLKHFPGHGSARADSHDTLPDISATWRPAELIPFQRAIQAGWPGAVMPGHLHHRGLDSLRPASLSAPVINGLLRGRLGFAGIVVSDDMQMGAVAGRYSLEERILLAVEAGTDILVFGNNSRVPDVSADEIHAVLLRLVREGRISPARIALSYARISRLKQRFAGWKP